MESLSGGNQQRALLALVRPGAKVMLLEQPTRGLDIESVIYLWSKLKERCNQGGAIIFTSSDLDELLRYSDRILVFFAGKVTGPLDAATTTVDQLGVSHRRAGHLRGRFGDRRGHRRRRRSRCLISFAA